MRVLVAILSLLWLFLLPATLAIAVIVGLAAVTGGWAWYVWLLLTPALYVFWLILFLIFCAPMIRRIGRRFPKPRRATAGSKESKGLMTVSACSLRMHLILSLPMVPAMLHSVWGRKLVMLAYSPSIHIGKATQIGGRLTDPDLTEVGDYVIVGTGTTIAGHMWMTTPSGKREYFTAPVKIGNHAIVGGACGVMMGCTIGDYSVIQPLSYLAPHTQVPPGEIWGGNPACFQAKRKGSPNPSANSTTTPTSSVLE